LIKECQDAALDNEYEGEIVIVNYKGVGPRIIESHDRLWAITGNRKDTKNKKRLKKIQFLTIKEYLSTHDWSREFTEEEAKALMEA
jgi:hypothetical protein